MSVRRRDVLIAGLVGLGLALVGCDDDETTPAQPDAAAPPPTDTPEDWSTLTAKLDAWFEGAPAEAVHAIGRQYLAGFADGDAVIADLSPLAVALGALADDEVARFVEQRVDEDFGVARVAMVAGWIFSETEVRLCALSERIAQASDA